jgi:hypothetical protein
MATKLKAEREKERERERERERETAYANGFSPISPFIPSDHLGLSRRCATHI